MKRRFIRILTVIKSYDFRSLNYRLIVWVIALSVLGINVISSAADDSSYAQKQIFGLILGIIVMIIFILIKYEFIVRYYWMLYAANILLMLYLTFFGDYHGGAKRWIDIGTTFQIQPTEISKIILLIFFSAFLVKNYMLINSPKFLLITAALFAVPFILIMMEPDLSTCIVILAMFCVIVFMSSISGRIIRRVVVIAAAALALALALIFILPADKNIIAEYQYERIVGFYDPDYEDSDDTLYQQQNSVIAIASGSVTGKGLHNNSVTSVKNAEFISEPHTDFIFTIIGEELGFVGSFATLLLLALIVFECFLIGYRARESIGKIIAVGFGSVIGIQTFINLAVVTMIIPNTGLTLPFVSYGLSSLVTLFAGIGIILNIGLKNRILTF